MAGLFALTGNVFDNAIVVTDTVTEMTVDSVKGGREICSDLGAGIKNKAALFREQSDEELNNWRANASKRQASALIKADVKFTKDLRKSLNKLVDIPEDLPLEDLAKIAKEFHQSTNKVVDEIIK